VNSGTQIGDNVLIGAGSILTNCTIEDGAVIDMGCIIEDGVILEKHSRVGSGARVVSGTVVKAGELWEGSPAIFRNKLNEEDIVEMNQIKEMDKQSADANANEQDKNESHRQVDRDGLGYQELRSPESLEY